MGSDEVAHVSYVLSTILSISVLGERSGSVEECLTQDQGAAGSSLTCIVVLEQDTLILA